MQTLDTLGAGFTLASHDLDIRGAGNLLGDEQSGHIREVGIELYQQMLEDAVADLRAGKAAAAEDRDWTPNINLGLPVLIPETYVRDLPVRLGLYRRIGALTSDAESEAMAAELVDRFGPLRPRWKTCSRRWRSSAPAARPEWRSSMPGRRAWSSPSAATISATRPG